MPLLESHEEVEIVALLRNEAQPPEGFHSTLKRIINHRNDTGKLLSDVLHNLERSAWETFFAARLQSERSTTPELRAKKVDTEDMPEWRKRWKPAALK